jgi:hypothetical protein
VIDYEIGPFTLADAAYASLRWGDDWNRRSLAHFAKKWDFDPESAFFTGHAWFFDRQHRRVGLPLRPAGACRRREMTTAPGRPFSAIGSIV